MNFILTNHKGVFKIPKENIIGSILTFVKSIPKTNIFEHSVKNTTSKISDPSWNQNIEKKSKTSQAMFSGFPNGASLSSKNISPYSTNKTFISVIEDEFGLSSQRNSDANSTSTSTKNAELLNELSNAVHRRKDSELSAEELRSCRDYYEQATLPKHLKGEKFNLSDVVNLYKYLQHHAAMNEVGYKEGQDGLQVKSQRLHAVNDLTEHILNLLTQPIGEIIKGEINTNDKILKNILRGAFQFKECVEDYKNLRAFLAPDLPELENGGSRDPQLNEVFERYKEYLEKSRMEPSKYPSLGSERQQKIVDDYDQLVNILDTPLQEGQSSTDITKAIREFLKKDSVQAPFETCMLKFTEQNRQIAREKRKDSDKGTGETALTEFDSELQIQHKAVQDVAERIESLAAELLYEGSKKFPENFTVKKFLDGSNNKSQEPGISLLVKETTSDGIEPNIKSYLHIKDVKNTVLPVPHQDLIELGKVTDKLTDEKFSVVVGHGTDGPAVEQMLINLNDEAFSHRFSGKTKDNSNILARDITEDFIRHPILILNEDKKVLGCADIERRSGTTCEANFVIAQSHQGKGLGKQLLEITMKQAKTIGYSEMQITVDPKNLAMLELARKLFDSGGDTTNRDGKFVFTKKL